MNISPVEFSKEEKGNQYKKLQGLSHSELLVLKKNVNKLHSLIDQILSTENPNDIEIEKNPFINKIYEVLKNHSTDPNFGVEDLSAAMFLSRSQLFRKLKFIIGENPNHLIRNYRLKKACSLLESYDGTASEIAYMVGFKNPSYFFKCFKDVYGMTPKDYMSTPI